MRSSRLSLIALSLSALAPAVVSPRAAVAQQEAQPVVYASYLECAPQALPRLDSLMTSFWGPIFDRQVSAGRATAWGWLSHHTGGSWDRVSYTVAPDVASELEALQNVGAEAASADRKRTAEFTAACPTHEDYIWQRVAGSQPAGQLAATRPAAGLSIYYECDPAREEVADFLATSAFAPALDGLVRSGDLNSWSWMRHLVGGKYRRILVTDGRDATTLIGAIGKLVTRLRAEQPDVLREFNDICFSHQDNVWNIRIAKP